MKCLRTNEPVVMINISDKDTECFLCQKCVDGLSEEKRGRAVLKTVEELFPDEAARNAFVSEYTVELDKARQEVKNQTETVKDCHDNFSEELMRQCHKNLINNNLPNILDFYNEQFQMSRSSWEEEQNLKGLRKLAESYAILLKIDDIQKKRGNEKDVNEKVLQGIITEMERLKKLSTEEIRKLHDEHLQDILDYVPNNFDELIKKD